MISVIVAFSLSNLIGFNPLNQVYRLNVLGPGMVLHTWGKSFNPLNQVYRLNSKEYNYEV